MKIKEKERKEQRNFVRFELRIKKSLIHDLYFIFCNILFRMQAHNLQKGLEFCPASCTKPLYRLKVEDIDG